MMRGRWHSTRICAARRIHRPRRDPRGTITVDFLLTFPIFLLLFAVIVQMALLGHAKLIAQYAAFAAARSAAVAVPEDKPEYAIMAGRLALAPVSETRRSRGTAASRELGRAVGRFGKPWDYNVSQRYSHAAAAARFTLDPNEIDVPTDITVREAFQFRLDVPGAAAALSPRRTVVGGVPGRYITLNASCTLRSTGSRRLDNWRLLIGLMDAKEVVMTPWNAGSVTARIPFDLASMAAGIVRPL
jgi:Flp pilus assembly protein TadG